MRQQQRIMTLCLCAAMLSPLASFADSSTVQTTETNDNFNPVTEIVIFPVRLVTAAIGAPIGAVGGLFAGFAKGFAFPGGHDSQTTTTTTTVDDDLD